MCLGALYWARPKAIYFANTRDDAAAAGFDHRFLYDELPRRLSERKIPMIQLMRDEALIAFQEWGRLEQKIRY
jgi:tRNA(Arg) A34 adenosine deaminase TadA